MAPSPFWTPSLLGIVGIGAALRLLHLNQPMRYDESVTYVYFAAGSWGHAVSSYAYPNNHVLHTLLVKACVTLFGNEPWAIRLPAFVAGIAMIPMTFSVGRRLFGSTAAYVATGLVSASGALAFYSTNARGYTMLCLATLVLADLLLRIRERPSAKLWIAVVLIIALGMWTVPVMLFPAGGLALWFALSVLAGDTSRRRADLESISAAVVGAAIVTLVLYSPIIAHDGLAALTGNAFVRASPWRLFFVQFSSSLKPVVAGWTLGFPVVISAVLGVCVIQGIADERRANGMRVSLLGSMYVWCACTLLITHRAPFARVWLFWVAPIALLSAHGMIRLLSDSAAFRDRFVPRAGEASVVLAAALALVVTLSRGVVTTRDTGTFRDAEKVTSAFSRVLHPGDREFAPLPSNAPLEYYFARDGVDTSYLTSTPTSSSSVYLIVNTDEGFALNTQLGDPLLKGYRTARLMARYPRSFGLAW